MSYTKRTWVTGETITAEKLNNIEDGIDDLDRHLSDKAPVIINTASGDIASFADGADNRQIKKIVGTIVPVQEGTGDPSPDNVRPISGWTRGEIGRCISLLNGITPHFDTGWAINSTTGASNVYSGIAASCSNYLDVSDYIGKEVYLNHRPTGNVGGFAFYDSSKQYVSGISNNGITTQGEWIITIPDNSSIKYMRFTANSNYLDKVILCLVETKETLPINWQSEAGTIYGGTVTLNQDGSADVMSNRGIVDLGTLAWYELSYKRFTSAVLQNMKQYGSTDIAPIISSELKSAPKSSIEGADNQVAIADGSIWVCKKTATNATNCKELLAGVQLVYELTTPQSYHFVNVGQLFTFFGANNIWIDTGSITECDYPADTKLYIDSLTAPDEDMIADSNIASEQYFTVNNKLYLSTAAIAAGASIIPGTNCTETNLAAALNALNT